MVKGAASGALSQTVAALTPKPATPPPSILSGGMSTGMKVAIGAAVAAPLLYLALRHRAPARAHNPRRKRRRSGNYSHGYRRPPSKRAPKRKRRR